MPARRILAHTKTNGRLAPSMQIKFVSATHDFDLPNGTILTVEDVRVDWDGRSELTAAELNARQWANTPVEDEEEETALGQARRFLRDLLADGSVLATDVKKAVSEAGISTPTLRRARTLENIIVTRRPVDDEPHQKWPWEWRLPPAVPTEANGDQEDEGDGAGTAMPENFASALCPEQGRHQIIRTPHDTYRCIKCFNEALRHPGCDALGQAHTLAIRDGIAGMEERYCTVCNTIVGSVDEHGDIPF